MNTICLGFFAYLEHPGNVQVLLDMAAMELRKDAGMCNHALADAGFETELKYRVV